jgi:hypothetical protein
MRAAAWRPSSSWAGNVLSGLIRRIDRAALTLALDAPDSYASLTA